MLGEKFAGSITGGRYQAFVPHPLPKHCPIPLDQLQAQLDQANYALGRLDGITTLLPDTSLFLYMYARKEAVVSSQIEGTQSSLSDLLLFELDQAPGVPFDDVKEVSNYVAALDHGIRRLREGFPLSLRLIREMHNILLASGRGSSQQPGEFRKSQNWLGGSTPQHAVFVPPPPDHLNECLNAFEKFLHEETPSTPSLIKIAMVHYQFETIHPFLDGNGRLGRLLITLMLCRLNILQEPILYLSLYFKTYRSTYYDLLQRVREKGDWFPWFDFFLTAIKDTSDQACTTSQDIMNLIHRDQQKIKSLGRAAGSAMLLFQYIKKKPITPIPPKSENLPISTPTIRKAMDDLLKLGIVNELTGKQRNRLFVYSDYLDILQRGADPL